jgi:1-acyl-sn-glycerol-3-phosphate acyltransferase
VILVRSALFNAVFYVATFVLTVFVGVPLILFAPRRTLGLGRFWAQFNLAALRAICGIRVEITGESHLPRAGAALIASQHQSAFDTMVWLTVLPRCCYVVKLELARIPLFGSLIRHTGMITIDRGAPTAAMRLLLREGRRAAAEARQIVIFPEGTRAQLGERLPLQSGVAALAAATGLPVIPVATDSGRCWSRRAFRKLPGTIHLAVGSPIPAGIPREDLLAKLAAAIDRGAREITVAAGG